MTSDYFAQLRKKVEEIEESEYRTQHRIRLVPPHIVLINPDNQSQYDQLLRRHRRENVLKSDFLTFPKNAQHSDNLLEEVNEQVFQKPWDRLALEYQINRIFIFLNQEKCDLKPASAIKLRKQLIDATFRKELLSHQVVYDCQEGAIREIRRLSGDRLVIIDPEKTSTIASIEQIVDIKDDVITAQPVEPLTIKKNVAALKAFQVNHSPKPIKKLTSPMFKPKPKS